MQHTENNNLKFNQKSGVIKHLVLRGGFLVITLLLMLVSAAFIDNGWWVLMALFLGFGLAVIWFLFILIESFILYSKKKNNLGNVNMIMIGISLLIGGIIFFNLNH